MSAKLVNATNMILSYSNREKMRRSAAGVADIAFVLNFQDPAYFARFFRRRVGLSPGEFKRQVLEGHPVDKQ